MSNATIQIEIGKRLRKLRKQANLSQQEVGKKLNLTSQAIANYENGKRDISSSMLLKFSKIYNVPISKLVGAPVNSNIPESFWNELYESNERLEEKLSKDFEVHIVGDIPEDAYNEIMEFIKYIKHKYGYPKK